MTVTKVLIGALCLSLSAACGDRQRGAPASADQAARDVFDRENVTIIVTGCLTASGDRFVLTELEPPKGAQPPGETTTELGAPAVPTTETYELAGLEDELRPHLGKQVRVVGRAEPSEIADIREITPSTPAGTSGRQDDGASVRSEAHTRVQMQKVRVSSVTPTGGLCPDGPRERRAR